MHVISWLDDPALTHKRGWACGSGIKALGSVHADSKAELELRLLRDWVSCEAYTLTPTLGFEF